MDLLAGVLVDVMPGLETLGGSEFEGPLVIRGAGTGAKLGTIEGLKLPFSLVVVDPTPLVEPCAVLAPTAETSFDVLVPGAVEVREAGREVGVPLEDVGDVEIVSEASEAVLLVAGIEEVETKNGSEVDDIKLNDEREVEPALLDDDNVVADCVVDVEEATVVFVVDEEDGELTLLEETVLALVVRLLLTGRELPAVDRDDEENPRDVSELWGVVELELKIEVGPESDEAVKVDVDESALVDEDVEKDSRV